MNQRSKRLWIENVAWTLVVSMSALQLTSGEILRSAAAQALNCVDGVAEGPVKAFDCNGCADGACPGRWRRSGRYLICGPTATGFKTCKDFQWLKVKTGSGGDCVEQYSTLAIVSCLGVGAGTGIAIAVASCAYACSPSVAAPPIFGPCMATCLTYAGVAGAIGGAGTGVLGCYVSCVTISRCNEGIDEGAYEADLNKNTLCAPEI
ncbi:MAG: hypothetical protein RLZZ326_312 [Planctomycetota bacterium]|jgi:hypothetical protein